MSRGIHFDYSRLDSASFQSVGPCVIWDNKSKLGYRPKSRCKFNVENTLQKTPGYGGDITNKCHGFPLTDKSLVILGEGFKSSNTTISLQDKINLLKYKAGIPLSYLNTTTGQNGGCLYDPTSWPFIYSSGSSATLSFVTGTSCYTTYRAKIGFQLFTYSNGKYSYNLTTQGIIANATSSSASGSGSITLTSTQLDSYLKNTTTLKNYNIIVALIDDVIPLKTGTSSGSTVPPNSKIGTQCWAQPSNIGCDKVSISLNYNGTTFNFNTSATSTNCENIRSSSSGLGELNPFPCSLCLYMFNLYGSINRPECCYDEIPCTDPMCNMTGIPTNYEECVSLLGTNGSGCYKNSLYTDSEFSCPNTCPDFDGTSCCKFFYPCPTEGA